MALPDPAGATVVRVSTAEQLKDAVLAAADDADVVVMAAAVADFRPATIAGDKIKKDATSQTSVPDPIELERTDDVLAELVKARTRADQVIVGFAAETGDDNGTVIEHARAKLTRKGCDLLVVNDVSGGAVFGDANNCVTVLSASAPDVQVQRASKDFVADVVLDSVVAVRS